MKSKLTLFRARSQPALPNASPLPLLFAVISAFILSLSAPLPAQEPDLEQTPPPAPAQFEPPPAPASFHRQTWRRSHSSTIAFRKHVQIQKDENPHDLIVLGGNLTLDGDANGDVVVVFGGARINGRVGGDLITLLGGVDLGPEAHIEGELYSIGGPFTEASSSIVERDRYVFSFLGPDGIFPNMNWLRDWFAHGLLLARPLPHDYQWAWGLAGVFLLIYVLLAILFPQPVQSCVEALQQRPLASFSLGLVTLILLGPILFLLVVSVAGILVIPILLCALFAAVFFGKTAVYACVGQQFTGRPSTSAVQLPLWAGLGLLLFYLLYMIPLLGFVAWGLATILALGSVLLAAFGGARLETERLQPAPAHFTPATPLAPPPASLANLPPHELLLLPRVGFWRRFLAALLDLALLALLLAAFERIALVIWAAYHIAFWTWRGTTIGGIVLGLKIIRTDGAPLTFPIALVRSLSSFFSAVVLFLGFFWAGWDRDKQAWHDKIAGTCVIKMPRGISLV